ncbi:hypothetical protein AYI70_g7346, partial [Smittium culicis]
VRPQTQECGRSISVDLFRQHNHTCLRKEIRRNNFPRTSQDSRKDLESLSGNKYQTSGHLCTVGSQSCRCAEQTDCANRMVSITGSIRNTEFSLWPARRRPVCIPPEQEGGSLLQLVPGHRVSRPECTSLQLVRVQQPIQLPAMESDLPSSSESPTRTSNNNSCDTNVEVCHLVSGPISSINLAAGPSASNDDHTRSKKRKVAALGKQALALDGLEDQRRFLESQGLGTYAADCILSNERRVRRRSRYSSVQQRFLDWRISKEITGEISAPQIINYLAEIYTVDKLKVGSIKAYKSALLRLAENPTELSNHPMFSEFTRTLDDASIKSYVRPAIDISPVLNLFKEWGPSNELSTKKLTAKLCWLLSVTGFLRASDIHRIDDKRSHRPSNRKTVPDKPSHRSDFMPSSSIFGL